MLGMGDDYLLYLYEHKKEDTESEDYFVDIAYDEIQKYIGKFEVDVFQWTDEMFEESTKKRVEWERIISIPDDLNHYKNKNCLFRIPAADENSDYKKINTTVDNFKLTVLLEDSMPSFIQCIEKYRALVDAMPTNPFAFEANKGADLYTKEELNAQFDKLKYFIEMMKTGRCSIVSVGL